VRAALTTLPWVEAGSIQADRRKRQVRFTVTSREAFDLDKVKNALGSQYAPGVKVLVGPTTQ